MNRHRVVALRRWGIATAVYLLAVFHRTSLGVAGLQASARFHIGPSALSVFVMLQLGVYAGLQIPTGILVDRFGSRRLLALAAALMAVAQALFAVAGNYPIALLARALLGAGDALTFVSVLRFAAGQFAPRRYPVVVAITTTLGLLGNLAATLPLSVALRSLGWTPTYLGAAAVTAVAGVAVYVMLPATPSTTGTGSGEVRRELAAVAAQVRSAWSMPGTRAGFWVHFSSMSTALMFSVLWGVPFLIQAEGMSRSEAGSLLLANVVCSIIVGPPLGLLIARYPSVRIPLAIGLCVATVLGWAAILASFAGQVPRPLIIVLVVFTSIGGPVSAIGFTLARDYNGPSVVGTATGVVNVAGFVAGVLESLVVGAVLQGIGNSRGGYRVAFAIALVVQAAGTAQMIRWWLRARAASLQALESGRSVPVPIVRHRWDLG